MSWIFGDLTGKNNKQLPENFDLNNLQNLTDNETNRQQQPSQKQNNKDQQQQEAGGGFYFGSTGLERAAKFARELEKSQHAKQIFDLHNEEMKLAREQTKTAAEQAKVAIEHARIEHKKVEYEERKKLLGEEAKIAQQKAQYDDQLARKRYQDQLSQQKKTNQDILREQEQSIARQEQQKYEALKRQVDIQEKSDLKKIEAKVLARGKIERENRDVYMDQIKLKATEERQTKLEVIKSLGEQFNKFVSDREKLKNVVIYVTVGASLFYTTKYTIRIVGRAIESRIAKPQLVKETTRFNLNDLITNPFKSLKRAFFQSKGDVLKDVILNPKLEEKLRDLSIAVKNTKKNKGTFANVLLYGPPGTGKTLFAKNLTTYTGMDYAILAGSDVSKLGEEAVHKLDKLFEWANTSRKGMIIYIDEADAFLRERSQANQNLRPCINAFLYHTGTASKNFMCILTSNLEKDLDEAVTNRIRKYIKFDLPDIEQRERLVRLYFEKFILEPASQNKNRIKVDNFDFNKMCSKIAELTKGFSAREISYLGQEWQAATYATYEGLLTEDVMMKVVEEALDEHEKKKKKQAQEEVAKSKIVDQLIGALSKKN